MTETWACEGRISFGSITNAPTEFLEGGSLSGTPTLIVLAGSVADPICHKIPGREGEQGHLASKAGILLGNDIILPANAIVGHTSVLPLITRNTNVAADSAEHGWVGGAVILRSTSPINVLSSEHTHLAGLAGLSIEANYSIEPVITGHETSDPVLRMNVFYDIGNVTLEHSTSDTKIRRFRSKVNTPERRIFKPIRTVR